MENLDKLKKLNISMINSLMKREFLVVNIFLGILFLEFLFLCQQTLTGCLKIGKASNSPGQTIQMGRRNLYRRHKCRQYKLLRPICIVCPGELLAFPIFRQSIKKKG